MASSRQALSYSNVGLVEAIRRLFAMARQGDIIQLKMYWTESVHLHTAIGACYFCVVLLPLDYCHERHLDEHDPEREFQPAYITTLLPVLGLALTFRPAAFARPIKQRVGRLYWSLILGMLIRTSILKLSPDHVPD